MAVTIIEKFRWFVSWLTGNGTPAVQRNAGKRVLMCRRYEPDEDR